ncbi:hypothetical protein EBB07_28395 [Paenibacillaceae bacterium]|nr:hypothetical protein EBB07_28395 [Paenibacillaceae bacterium]
MKLTEMEREYELAKIDFENVKSRAAKLGVRSEMNKLYDKIQLEKNRVNTELRTTKVKGVEISLPTVFEYLGYRRDNSDVALRVEDNIIYAAGEKKVDSDGSYRSFNYVWIPQTDSKFAKLCVRILGGNIYGDRFYLSVEYFKHPADQSSYLSKDLRTDNKTYNPYCDYFFDKLNLERKKDRNKTNLLQPKNEGVL